VQAGRRDRIGSLFDGACPTAATPDTGRTERLRRDDWPGPNGDHWANQPFRIPHRRRDLRSLRRKSVQEAFRGVLACQGPENPSLPGKARGFRGQDTVERHGGFDVVMEKIVHQEQENPAANGRERIDDFRLAGVKDVAS